MAPAETKDLGSMSGADRAYLDALFAPSIAATERLTGMDLSDWLRTDYAEPMRAA
jgi:hypothetical protein